MPPALPETNIIIPTRDRPEALKRCLNRIHAYLDAHPECTVVVTDDGNSAETRQALGFKYERVHVIQGPGRGPAANRNFGAANCCAPLLIFLDDDCIPEPDIVGVYQRAAVQEPEIGVFEGRISADGIATSFGDGCPTNETGGYLWSCNFAIRRELFSRIGGFEERFPFPAMEDVDLRFRVNEESSIRFLPDAGVLHPFERRLGWKVLKHRNLSALLYSHIRGMDRTRLGPAYYAHVIGNLTRHGVLRILRRKQAEHPQHLLSMIWINIEMLLITVFWRFHPFLAKKLFPPCCAGCRSIHANLAGV